jgi:hypothetical protein
MVPDGRRSAPLEYKRLLNKVYPLGFKARIKPRLELVLADNRCSFENLEYAHRAGNRIERRK